MTVVLGSQSELKIRAVKAAFAAAGMDIDLIAVQAESGVSAQPVGFDMMEAGARGRVGQAKNVPGGDFYIGIENGLVELTCGCFDPPCVVIEAANGQTSVGFGAFFPIPRWMAIRTLRENSELGEVIKKLAGGGEKDPMKYLSKDTIPREQILQQAVHCALVPLLFPDRNEEH